MLELHGLQTGSVFLHGFVFAHYRVRYTIKGIIKGSGEYRHPLNHTQASCWFPTEVHTET